MCFFQAKNVFSTLRCIASCVEQIIDSNTTHGGYGQHHTNRRFLSLQTRHTTLSKSHLNITRLSASAAGPDSDRYGLIQLTRAVLHARSLARFARTTRGGLPLAQLSNGGYPREARTHTENTAVLRIGPEGS